MAAETIKLERGFTLIEMLIVLLMMMVFLALVAPSFGSVLHRAKTAGFAQQIALLMQQARFEAIKTGSPASVVVEGESAVATLAGERIGTAIAPARVHFEPTRGFDASGTVSFQTDGSTDGTGAFRIADDWTNQMEIAVEPQATGRIEIRKKSSAGVYVAEGAGGEAWSFE